jgi:hypothetical protein
MTNQALTCLPGLLAAPVHAALAVDVRWLPEEITLALVPAAAATTGLLLALFGVIRRESPERLRRLVLVGNLLGAAVGLAGFLTAVLLEAFA